MGKGGNGGNVDDVQRDRVLWYIHGKAYDLSTWLDMHPGGSYLLTITKATEVTALYESYHAASLKETSIKETLKKFEVPCASPLQPPQDWSAVPIYDELKEMVKTYRRLHGIKATDSPITMAWYAIIFALHYTAFTAWVLGVGGRTGAFFFGVTIWLWAADMLHSGTHYAMTYDQRLGEWLGWLGGAVFILPSAWVRQHVIGHHVHTNEFGKDPDLYMYYKDVFKKRPNAIYFTPWVAEIFPSFVGTIELLLNSKSLRNQSMSSAKSPWSPGEYSGAWCTLLGLLGTMAYVASHSSILQSLTPFFVAGVLFYIFSQVSHINDDSFAKPPSGEWAAIQITTSQGDYRYDSEFWNKMSIGLNNQALHHLFPTIHPCHFPALAKLMKPTFQKHGLPTVGWSQTIGQALAKHWSHMKLLKHGFGRLGSEARR